MVSSIKTHFHIFFLRWPSHLFFTALSLRYHNLIPVYSQFRPLPPFITCLQSLSGDDHLSSTSSHNRLVNALIAFSLCGLHRGGDRSSANERCWEVEGCSKKRLLYMSSNPPPPPSPRLNDLVAIIPASRLHYSPHSIDLKSDLSISTHTHTQGFMWTVQSSAALL